MNQARQLKFLKTADITLAYLLLRIVVGINYFNHGFTRMGNISGFANSMIEAMEGAWMPDLLVRVTAYFVPPIELIFGFLLIIGLFTRLSLLAIFILMAILMYGVTIVQNWSTASSQLIYNIVLFVLLAGLGYNQFSFDTILAHRKRNSPKN